MQTRIAAARLVGLQPGMAWLLAHHPVPASAPVLCHGDFHPLNILLDRRRVSGVLDWAWSKIDDPAWDVGATVALMTQGPVHLPRLLRGPVASLRAWLVARYLRAYRALRPLELDAVRYYEGLRCLAMLIEVGEHAQAGCGAIAPIAKLTAFAEPQAAARLCSRFRAISGVAAAIDAPPRRRAAGAAA